MYDFNIISAECFIKTTQCFSPKSILEPIHGMLVIRSDSGSWNLNTLRWTKCFNSSYARDTFKTRIQIWWMPSKHGDRLHSHTKIVKNHFKILIFYSKSALKSEHSFWLKLRSKQTYNTLNRRFKITCHTSLISRHVIIKGLLKTASCKRSLNKRAIHTISWRYTWTKTAG